MGAVITDLKSPLNIWYLDDGTIGGKPEEVEQDLLVLLPRLKDMGLEVNTSKFPEALQIRRNLLLLAGERLKGLTPHVALVLLQKCFAVPKITYLLRTAPVWLFPGDIETFDLAIKSTIESVVNVSLDDIQWTQAGLPIRHGGIGVRRVGDISLPAFLASAHGVADLVAKMLSLNGDGVSIPYVADAVRQWLAINPGASVPENPRLQRAWDEVGCKATLDGLVGNASGVDRARLLAVARPESGAWLQALPSPQLGTLLDGDSLRVSVALRLGCDVCQPHLCICGSTVGADGHHALSCRRCVGRHPRHHALNDIVQRALRSAGVPSVLEPPGLSRTDGKRPDCLTLVPWERGRCLVWDATCVSTFAASHISRTARAAGAAAESQAAVKRQKYVPLGSGYIFVPFAVETAGCWGADAKQFVRDIGRRLRQKGEDPRSESFLVQRLSIAIQRGNATRVWGREDRVSDDSACSNIGRGNETNRGRGESRISSQDKKRMQLKICWQENIAKFESIKRHLHEKQRDLLKLYATLRSSHKELLEMGQTMCLPPSEDLSIMNVGKLAPGQLLQLCAGRETNETQISHTPFDIHLLREIQNKIVTSCEETLNSRNNIIDWFEDVMAKKTITRNDLVKKIKEFKTENEVFKRSLDKNKVDYLRFLNNSQIFLNSRHDANSALANELCFQSLSLKLTEVNALNDELRKKLKEAEDKATFAENKSRESEKQLRDAKHKKRDHMSRAADLQLKFKEEEMAHLNVALEQAHSKSRILEKTVCQLREENQEMQSNYDNVLKKLNESIDINTKLFDEITADRSKLLVEKQDLENQLLELSKNFEETLHTTKHESNLCIAKLVETEKKYKEVLDEKNILADKIMETEKQYKDVLDGKNILADKIESMCAQLLESELRFKNVSKKLIEMESNSRDVAECRKKIDVLNFHLENTKEELLEYKTKVTQQTVLMQELRQNWNNAVDSEKQLKNNLNNKEKYILELEGVRNLLEQRLLESELKIQTYSEELSNIKTVLREVFGEFETIVELHEMIKQQTLQLVEANLKNNTLTEDLIEKDIELQKRVEIITEQEHLLEELEATLKMLTVKNEEQTNIIKLLRNNLDDRTQADIEINRQLDEKNTEIESLMNYIEKRKEQVSQLEKIILTLENQIVKLSNQKRTARETVLSLEKKLSEYESYNITDTKKTNLPIDNLDNLINILEYELTNPSDDQFNYSEQEVEARRNKRRAHNDFKTHIQDDCDMYQLLKNVPTKGMSTFSKNRRNINKDNYKGDGVCGNKIFPSVPVSEFAAVPKGAANATKENKNLPVARQHHTTNVNYCLMPNHIKDEKKLKMFKLAGHKLQ
ncbi:coiled-coil domain-containing protein 18-like [Cydia splendana]|uniref:coiled-coil domain-containing protein 18-like n=1 Tax=Cydia splendana TaxID=1100963 RepID=UPI00300C1C06